MLTFEAPLSHAWLANKNSAAGQFIAFLLDHHPNYFSWAQTENAPSFLKPVMVR